jgi:dTMP kinase
MLLESVQENRSTSNLRLAATNFIAIEQLHAHRQTAYTVLARDQVAQKSANEALQKTSAQLNVRLQALQTVLENEKTSRAKTDEELVAIKAAAASAQEQARVAEAARLKELASVKTAADAAQEQARAAEAARMKELASIKAAADAAKEEARLAEAALAAANREIERLRAAHAVSPVPNPQEIQAIPAPAT